MLNIVLYSFAINKGLKSIGPRALLDVSSGGKITPLIIKQIDSIKKTFKNKRHRIYLIIGYQKEKIVAVLQKYGYLNKQLVIIENNEYMNYGEAYPILSAIKNIGTENTLIIGDGVIPSKIETPNQSCIYGLSKKKTNFNIGYNLVDNKIQYICYDIDNCWSEIFFLHKKDVCSIIDSIDSNIINTKIRSMFLFEFINYLVDYGISIACYPIRYNSINKHISMRKVNI